MTCSAETVISILQIPLQLKLLHPWNRGIHGYIRSHVKGCLSVSLFFSSPHLFPHSSFERNHCATPRFPTATICFCKWDPQWIISITLMKIDWLLNISKLWMQTILHPQLHLLDSEGMKCGAGVVQCHRGCRLKYCIGASPIRRICSLQNNLLPWQRNFIIQAHCYLLSQQESNVP